MKREKKGIELLIVDTNGPHSSGEGGSLSIAKIHLEVIAYCFALITLNERIFILLLLLLLLSLFLGLDLFCVYSKL